MSDRDEKTTTQSPSSSDAIRGLRKTMGRIFKSKDDALQKALAEISSIQACKDAAITADDDLRLLAVCKLGDFGSPAFETLDIALNDDSLAVRAVAAGVLASLSHKKAIPVLERHQNDDNERVRDAIKFSIAWLEAHGVDAVREQPKPRPAPPIDIDILETTPIRTSDDVIVVNGYKITDSEMDFKTTVENKTEDSISDVTVSILSFPPDSLIPPLTRTQTIKSISPGKKKAVDFGFIVKSEGIEGEIISSVTFRASNGDKIAAKSGNCFIRSIYSQIDPFEMSAEEFQQMKKGKNTWNREHVVEVEASELYKMVKKLAQRNNLYVLKAESTKKKGTYLGVIAGVGKGRFNKVRVVITITLVGTAGEGISKVRIDAFSDDPEIIQIAASEFFEKLQIEMQTT